MGAVNLVNDCRPKDETSHTQAWTRCPSRQMPSKLKVSRMRRRTFVSPSAVSGVHRARCVRLPRWWLGWDWAQLGMAYCESLFHLYFTVATSAYAWGACEWKRPCPCPAIACASGMGAVRIREASGRWSVAIWTARRCAIEAGPSLPRWWGAPICVRRAGPPCLTPRVTTLPNALPFIQPRKFAISDGPRLQACRYVERVLTCGRHAMRAGFVTTVFLPVIVDLFGQAHFSAVYNAVHISMVVGSFLFADM